MDSLDATALNEYKSAQTKLEEAMQELHDVKSKLEALKLEDDFKPIRINKYSELQISDQIKEKNVFAVEMENDEKKQETLLFKLKDEELSLIATINEQNEIILSKQHKELYEKYVKKEELDKPYVVDINELVKEKKAQMNIEEKESCKKEQEEREENQEESNKNNSQFSEIANALGIDENDVMAVVKIHDAAPIHDAMKSGFDTTIAKPDISPTYAVKLRSNAGEISNRWNFVKEDDKGEYKQISGNEVSDTTNEIVVSGKVTKNWSAEGEIRKSDLKTIPTDKKGVTYIEVDTNHLEQGDETILETQKGIKETEPRSTRSKGGRDMGEEAYERRYNRGH